jgi:serine/threonine protein kinase/tetratricopeptide (TPR) repeat protein
VTDSAIDDRAQLQSALGDAYVVERQLGRGGMATVWLAHDTKHKRPVAIKVLHADLAASLGAERFQREIEVAARLQHPHILSVHDSGSANGVLWFSMPFVEGETLRAHLEREKQLPVDEAIRITREASQALQYAHDHGVVHRDIKPENLLLTSDGNTLVADFGIAQALGAETTLAARQRLTETGLVVGTPQYMSPEQASGDRALDARTDMYSLATVLYEMLAGEPPFTGPNAQTVRAKMLSGPPPSVRRARPAITPALDAALDKALALSPADRFASVADFSRTLATVETAAHEAAPSSSNVGMRVAASVLAVVVIVGVLYLWPRSRNPVIAGDSALAVLPFENDGDTSNAYFADGITDEIRGKLTAMPALRVIARASSNQYRRSDKSPQQIAHELGARYLLTGVVRWETSPTNARRVRVSPELVQLSQENAPRTIWQQTYDTTLADVFQVQSAVASKVAANLGVVLNASTQAQLAQRPTQNPAAYEAYLRSTAFDGTDLPTVRRALVDADRAIELDSNYAAAWARAARLHGTIYSNGTQQPSEAEASRVAAQRAVELDSSAYGSYVSRAIYYDIVASNETASLADLKTAQRLAPNSFEVLRTLGQVEATTGRWEEGLAHIRQAAALDPRSPLTANRLTRAFLWLHRFPEARAAAEQGLVGSPENLALIDDRVMSYLGEGNLAAARLALRQIPTTIDRGMLLAYVANYWDKYWMFDSADVALAATLSPASYDGSRAVWGVVHAEMLWQQADSARARAYADSAIAQLNPGLRADSTNWQSLLFRGLMLAYLGKRAEAIRDRDRGLALSQTQDDEWSGVPYAEHVAARIDVAIGDRDAAIAQLRVILAKPYVISPAWLRIDPAWNFLRGDPRFEKLAHSDGK